MVGDERPIVEAFAAMHPRLDPHFTPTKDTGMIYRWNDFFHLMGALPRGYAICTCSTACSPRPRKEGCDVLLLSEWGNFTFSDKGNWGFVEYFLNGRWRQLWLALPTCPDQRPIDRSWRFCRAQSFCRCSQSPVARCPPDVFPRRRSHLDLMQPLSQEYRITSGADRRLKESTCLRALSTMESPPRPGTTVSNDDGEP